MLEAVLSKAQPMAILQGLSMPSNQHAAAFALGIGVALLAGAAGVYFIQRQSLWSKKKLPKSLTAEVWRAAFDQDGRVGGFKGDILGQVRRGGVAAEIRSEVWPFLLGLHEADSTEGERKKRRSERKRKYLRLRKQVASLSQRVQEESARLEKLSRQQRGEEALDKKRNLSKEWKKQAGSSGSKVESDTGVSSVEEVSLDEDGLELNSRSPDNDAPPEDEAGESMAANGVEKSSRSASESTLSSLENLQGDAQALEEFQTWQRIICLDAVRMNAAWIPYAPVQARCDPETAEAMAKEVGLENDEHLEPARRAHAARLVAILEAYAVYDKETGYCQGMSDLLSPFVALIDNDAEAFWCFQRLMKSAKHNFRIDEKGIRGQLDRIASILEKGDPILYRHLTAMGAGDCIFAYRMVVVLFRRELSFEQTLGLWEVCWADALAAEFHESVQKAISEVGGNIERSPVQVLPTKELLLFTIAAAVRQRRQKILAECTAMDEVLSECNSMANNVDLWRTLIQARELVRACTNK